MAEFINGLRDENGNIVKINFFALYNLPEIFQQEQISTTLNTFNYIETIRANYVTKNYLNAQLETKVDKTTLENNYITKTAVNSKFETINNELENIYQKDEVYNKTEVDNKIATWKLSAGLVGKGLKYNAETSQIELDIDNLEIVDGKITIKAN